MFHTTVQYTATWTDEKGESHSETDYIDIHSDTPVTDYEVAQKVREQAWRYPSNAKVTAEAHF